MDNLFARIAQRLAFAGEAKFLFTSFDESHIEVLLEGVDFLTDGRLGDAVHLGGSGEVAGFRQVTKDP